MQKKDSKKQQQNGVFVNAIMIAIVLVALYFLNIIKISHSSVAISVLYEYNFVFDICVIFLITIIYNLIAYREPHLTMAVYGAIFSALYLTTYAVIPSGLLNIIEGTVALFLVLYLGFWIASRSTTLRFAQIVAVLLIVLIAFLYISKNPNTLQSLLGMLNITTPKLSNNSTTSINYISSTLATTSILSSYSSSTSTVSESTTTIQNYQATTSNQTINYMLGLINNDRSAYGLQNVTLSNISSAQQHASSMLQNNYFSHWDVYGLKPYMRYTLVGGRGAVSENIAYKESSVQKCSIIGCVTSGDLNITSALAQMEYSMMYNDSACCDNGHRFNILNPNHNQISIGIAYNSSTALLVEDFINNYITWFNQTPSFYNGEVLLQGAIDSPYKISGIEISYDAAPYNMTVSQLDNTSDYNYGPIVAGVVQSSRSYYANITTIVADKYITNNNQLGIDFNITNLTTTYGEGAYTILVFITGNATGANSTFIGSTYTIFINSNGKQYYPNNV